MTERPRVLSADSHIVEPPDLFVETIDPKFRERAPRVVEHPELGMIWDVEGLGYPSVELMGGAGRKLEEIELSADFDRARQGGWDPAERLRDMDTAGVDGALLYPTIGFHSYGIADPALLNATLAAWNSWIADFCNVAPDRLKGVGCIVLDDIDQAISEMTRCKELGLATMNVPSQLEGDHYGTSAYDRFWAAAQDLAMPISTHIGSTRGALSHSRAREQMRRMVEGPIRDYTHVAVALPDAKVQEMIFQLIASGVFERFPDLKFVCAEFEAGWAASMLTYMDSAVWEGTHPYVFYDLPMKPSEYFQRNMALTFIRDSVAVRCRDIIGIENLMWSDDYPHLESCWPDCWPVIDEVMPASSVSLDDREMILNGNARRIYGF
ncbi:MAG: amidohydrolase [Deltaproteobacteria bacterium]|jgi:predicted TIM-barrel fold metal-dependent hydrolase|nr:amidohydrolase [Deltaproteobacteria bacterium]MBW2497803.1 amidohydrolase [Deltaproteobacteria bacterium]